MQNVVFTAKIALIGFLFCGLFSCEMPTEYQQMKSEGLASGVRHDSIFLGMYLGMTQDSFFKHCWRLNKEEVLTHGSMNMSVEYELKQLRPTAKMNFYPNFYEGKIYEMPAMISDSQWAPWNPSSKSDSIKTEVKELMEVMFGKGFIKVDHPKKNGFAWVKVDGNRRISIHRQDERIVRVVFTDLTVEKEAKAANKAMLEASEKEAAKQN